MTTLGRMLLVSFLLVAIIGVTGCASNTQDDFTVTIPPPELSTTTPENNSSISITFKQENQQIVSRTVAVQGSYTGGEDASLSEVRSRAIEAMIKAAVDQVNGQLISNTINIRQTLVGSGQLEETRRDVVSQTVGLGKLMSSPKCRQHETRERSISFTCTGKVAVPLIESVKVKREGMNG